MLLQEVLLRLPGQRIVELTNAENAGGLRLAPLAGTVTVTGGSVAVLGAGTAFVTSGLQGNVVAYGGVVVQFASQPGVNYVVSAVADDTHLTLVKPYGASTSAGIVASLPGVVYPVLQQACFDAQQNFMTRTNFVYDDVTQNANVAGANPVLNKCVWAAIALVTYYLCENGRGFAWTDAQIDAAWRVADNRLRYVLANYGDGAMAAPVTDSVFTPSVGPQRLPQFDNERWGDVSPLGPGPGPSGTPWGGGGGNEWGW